MENHFNTNFNNQDEAINISDIKNEIYSSQGGDSILTKLADNPNIKE